MRARSVLSTLVVLALSACGRQEASPPVAPSEAPAAATPPAAAPAPETAPAASSPEREVFFGAVHVHTGYSFA